MNFTLEISSESTDNKKATAESISEKRDPEPFPPSIKDCMVLYGSNKGTFYLIL